MYTFNKDYSDREQVREFMPAFLARYDEIVRAGQYPYNDSFKGHIPGIEGPSEDNAIYMLQNLKRLDELDVTIATRLVEGFRPVEATDNPVKYSKIVHYGWYMGGTGYQEWENARLVKFHSSTCVLPKGKRTNGFLLSGKVLAK